MVRSQSLILGIVLAAGIGPVSPAATTAAQTPVSQPRPPKFSASLAWQHDEKWVVNSIAFSPDGRLLATGRGHGEIGTAKEHAVKLWDVATGRLVRTIAHPGAVHALAFAPAGGTLASADSGKTVLLWNPANGWLRRTLSGHTDRVQALVYSPDGRTLASSSVDGTIRLWDVASGRMRHTLRFPPLPVRATRGRTRVLYHLNSPSARDVAFAPDGRTLAACYGGATIFWNTRTGRLDGRFPSLQVRNLKVLYGRPLTYSTDCIRFSPDGKLLACGGVGPAIRGEFASTQDYGLVTFRAARGGAVRRGFTVHRASVIALAYFPDGRTLATAGDEGTLRLHDVTDLDHIHTLATLRGRSARPGRPVPEARAIAVAPDGRSIATGDVAGGVKLWHITR